MKTRLFVFEGPDESGKSTLAAAFGDKIRESGAQCDVFAFPGREEGTLGNLVHKLHHASTTLGVKSLTASSLQLLHIAAHVDAIESRIIPALKARRTVVLDRFWWSTWVYGKISGVNENSLKAMIRAERIAWSSIKPTAIFLIKRDVSQLSDAYMRLTAEYTKLAEREARRTHVYHIGNNAAVDEALARIIAVSIAGSHSSNGPMLPSMDSQPGLPLIKSGRISASAHVFAKMTPAKPTVVFDTYWKFAAKRQDIFFKRVAGERPPWTDDPILLEYKFTNAYRASDRVSQYLIKHVIYDGDPSPSEIFFRILLFKLFNRIETWQLLQAEVGTIRFSDYSFERYDTILSRALSKGTRIYSGAYIMPSGGRSSGPNKKHKMHLRLLEQMVRDDVPLRLSDSSSMRHAFELMRSYPTIGDFLGYQYVTDLNYSNLTNFSEMDFAIAGPGARDGIRKCFASLGGLSETDMIRRVTDRQELEFERLGLNFKSLWGRPLQLIDCQNLFCEVDKYARVEHPDITGITGRARIKQRFRMQQNPLVPWYPPKWGLNERISGDVLNVHSVSRANS